MKFELSRSLVKVHFEDGKPLNCSKKRKLEYFINKSTVSNCNAIVTAGAANSNHARATAMLCADKSWKCTIVVHDIEDYSKGNLLLMKLAGARLIFTSLENVGSVMDQEMQRLKDEGFSPYYIYGGGHGLPGYLAFYEAAKDYVDNNSDFIPDYVVHASGTGGTQAGLVVGFNQFAPKTKVLGVSVARNRDRGASVVKNSCNELTESLNLPSVDNEKIIFFDEWNGGGYGKTYPELFSTIRKFANEFGLITDPTYTGKALHGLTQLVENGYIPSGSKVLFWHTGGLINLFDYTKELVE